MLETRSVVFLLGVSLAACSTPAEPMPPPAPKPQPPVVQEVVIQAPAKAPTAAVAAGPTQAEADALFAAEQWAEAAKAYEAITKREPANADAWFRLGYSLHVAGQLDAAIAAHTKAAEFLANRKLALYNLGCAQALKGNADAAFDALSKAVDTGFSDAKLLMADPDLNSLRSDGRYAILVERLTKPQA